MNNYNFKTFGVILMFSLLPIAAISQLRTPENVPITFYGKVIDQNEQPVGGARVNFDFVTSHVREFRTDDKPMSLTTDDDGRFLLSGVTGYAIDQLSIRKEGYELSQKAPRSFVFGLRPNYKPDSANPVVFKMWKLAGKEQLIHSSWRGKVACDGTTNRFDLFQGKRSNNGNLEVVCTRTPLTSPPPGNERFDYKIEVALIGGAIRVSDDEFKYLAPENDYSPILIFGQKADDLKWNVKIPKDYYFKTADGRYGRLFLDWYAAQDSPTHLEWNCSINPSGSRNLER